MERKRESSVVCKKKTRGQEEYLQHCTIESYYNGQKYPLLTIS